ncbi:hypothetical protein CK203_074780 [Vitis vinifera]|uniref:Uncharacterized protein n=1 Tax=Vitis vinifera TaxID=29760 RepID=A0A438DLX3_VITVI|nr:hypothetical protein CK203_074780 [Vitis vinifera]
MQLTRFFHFVFYLLREGRELMHHHCYPGLSCDVSVASKPIIYKLSELWLGYCYDTGALSILQFVIVSHLAGAYSSMGAISFSPRARRTTKKRYLIISSIY